MAEIPLIDRSVKYVGASKLRDLNAATLKESEDTFVIQDNDGPFSVILSYEKYLAIQDQLLGVVNTMEMISDTAELKGVAAGLTEIGQGRTRTLTEIQARLRRKHEKEA
jgi:hypothetical protein